MSPDELQVYIDELETKVERLRALYDQYFMGIEKIEPSVLRKDVERRFWTLRREQIRNTGLRFKLNMVSQRYNTFQQYWQRICREMENGTYKRDVRRAAKRFGAEALTIAAKRRYGKLLEDAKEQPADQEEFEVEVDFDFHMPNSTQPAAPVPAAAAAPKRTATASLVALDDLFADDDLPPSSLEPMRQHAKPIPPPAPTPVAQQRSAPLIPGIPRPLPPPPRRALPNAAPGAAPLRRPVAPTATPPVARAAAPAPATVAKPLAPPARPVPPTKLPAAAAPVGVAAPPRKAPAQPAPVARPAAPRTPDDAISDARVREIYRRYVDAKRQCRESTSGVTEEALGRTLRASAEKLQRQHSGRNVDFDVVIKDGKAVLKPVVRGS